MLTRRSLFGILAGAVAAPIVVRAGLLMPVKALIEPEPQEFIVTGIVNGNTLLTPASITREALRILHEKVNFAGAITREITGTHGFRVGDVIRISRPPVADDWPANYSEGFAA